MLFKIIPTHVYQVRIVDLVIGIHTSKAFAGSPRYVHSRGPRRIPSLVVENTLDSRCNYCDGREDTVDERGNSITTDGRGMPWKLLWFYVCGNCSGNFRRLPWVAIVGTTEFSTDRTAARAVATTVTFAWKLNEPWPLPWKPANFHGSPWHH